MEIVIHGSKVKITDAMHDYIEEKLEKLEKYLENSDDVRANVIVKVKNHEQTVEITIPLKSFILRSEETKEDFYAAVDKTIEIKPMNEEEAILQMELLGHQFYMFKDSETDKYAVVYKRNDEHYGIMESE